MIVQEFPFLSGEFSRRSQGYYGEVGAALYKIAARFYKPEW